VRLNPVVFVAHSILYRRRTAKRSELLDAYFVGLSYDKPSRVSEEGHLGEGKMKIRSGTSESPDIIKIYKAFPIRNPRPDLRSASDVLSLPEEKLHPISMRSRIRLRHTKYPSQIPSYNVLRPEEEPLSGLTVYKRYAPSEAVTKAFFESSNRILGDFKKSLFFLPAKFLQPSRKPKDVLLKQTGDAIGEAVHGALQTLAYRAAAFEAKTAQVSDSPGELVEPFTTILYECLPVRIADMKSLLETLRTDLELFASGNPVLAKWGSLHNGPEGMFVNVRVILPAKPPPGDSVVVGGYRGKVV